MKKSLVIIFIILLLAVLAAGGWWALSAKQTSGHEGVVGSLFHSAPPEAGFLEVQDLIITLQGEEGRERYLLLDLVLVVRGEDQSAKATRFEPAVRSATVALLNNQPYASLRTRPVSQLHDELLKRYQQESSRLGLDTLPFDDVMISKMVFQ